MPLHPQVSQNQHAQYLPVPPTGAVSYALGFLAFIGIPFLSLLVAGIVMAAVYPSAKRKGGLAAENARRAANWGITAFLIATITLVTHFVLLFTATGTSLGDGFYPVGIPITIFAATFVVHLVVIICGLVKANRREVLRNPLAIPFIRSAQPTQNAA
ncbi:uncharacterized protein DUF4870 [Promicromonospora sp. AC04]|nr:uncharacterized protein DUF4870 [Promicromonospora sp. AC04]